MSTEGSSGLSRARSTSVQDVVSRRVQAATKTQETTSQYANIKESPFYQIMANQALTPEAKISEAQKYLSSATTKAEMQARVADLESLKGWAQERREAQASKLMSLTDTTTNAELQATYRDINKDLADFDEKMKPIVEMIDAVYKIRMTSPNGTVDAYRIIKDAAATDARHAEDLRLATEAFDQKKSEIQEIENRVVELSHKKGFFGLGGLSNETKAQIEQLEASKADKIEELAKLAEAKDTLAASSPALGEGTEYDPQALQTIREMLDLSSEQHTQRQKDLVAAAMNFVKTTKNRMASISSHLDGQESQLDNVFDANYKMTELYAILNESTTGAMNDILAKRAELATKPEGESRIAEMDRLEKLRALDEYIERLKVTGADTDITYADLSTGGLRIDTMRKDTRNQINGAKAMQTRGIAGVADRLVVTLQALSQAAIHEAQAAAIDTNRAMMEKTNAIAQNEVIKAATGNDEMNEDLKRVFDDLLAYKEVSDQARVITTQAMTEMQQNLEAVNKVSQEVNDSARDLASAAAETLSRAGKKPGEGKLKGAAPASSDEDDGFLGKGAA